jgi:23S rRNA pseudouridine2605 synthase
MNDDNKHNHDSASKPRRAKNDAPAKAPEHKAPEQGDRIAKVMARAGLCSRRDAESWIAEGRVSVNGAVLTSAALNVTAEDRVKVDGRPLATRERTRLFLFHKPRGLVTTDRDPEGRSTVFDYIAEKFPNLPRLMSVGRLDINTEGLLLLTNDGGLSRVLELPATGWLRRYRARANGETDQTQLDTLSRGVTIDGVEYAGVDAKLDRVQGANVWISLGLREGKNREVKRLLEHVGLAVNRLIRLSYGPFQLGELDEGAVEEVKTRILADQLGEALAAQANVDLDGPVFDREPEPEPERERPSRRDDKRGARSGARDDRAARPRREGYARTESYAGKREGAKKPAGPREKIEPRKHVSALRDERASAEKGPRRRTERAATEDRNGRKVAVERVSSVASSRAAPASRNARRFRDERDGVAEDAPRQPRGPANDQSRGGGRDRHQRAAEAGETGAAKVFRRGPREEGGRDAPRSFEKRPYEKRGERPDGPRKFDGAKKFEGKREFSRPEGRGGERPASGGRFERGDSPRSEGRSFGGDRPARSEGRSFAGKPAGERPAGGRSFGDKPAGGRSFGDRPASGRSFGDKPAGGKSFGDRPGGKSFGGKPGGRPFGGKPSGGRPTGGRPAGERPSGGGKPRGR